MKIAKIDAATQKNIDLWLNGHYDEESKQTLLRLLRDHPTEAIDAFYTTLSFGTGGLRGIMGVGVNRINVYTIRAATAGLAQYILKNKTPGKRGVFIGYDSRHHSKEFAEEAASVLAAHQIPVFLCPEMRPVPYISFGCRFKGCQAAIAITASHNPAHYNGYKVYWSDGGQVVPPHDSGIMSELQKIADASLVKKAALSDPLIEYVGREVDEAYLAALSALQRYPADNALKITYTPLHGTGITFAPKAFASWGFQNVHIVKEQATADGDFPTAPCPNPEEDAALQLGLQTMRENGSDLLLATDPDADRVGVIVKHEGRFVRLSGNQVACLLLEHVLSASKPKNGACIKTIVTSELFQAICDAHHIACFNVLTGFKYIAEKIHAWEAVAEYQFLFGAEESYGYMRGTYTRDKDGIMACLLIAEAAQQAKRSGQTLIDKLNALYQKYGAFAEELYSHQFPETKKGKEQMAHVMEKLQNAPPTHLLNKRVAAIEDYGRSLRVDLISGAVQALTLPTSPVLLFWLEDKTKLIVRPSGTEPKVKIYCGVTSKTASYEECSVLAKSYIEALRQNFLI